MGHKSPNPPTSEDKRCFNPCFSGYAPATRRKKDVYVSLCFNPCFSRQERISIGTERADLSMPSRRPDLRLKASEPLPPLSRLRVREYNRFKSSPKETPISSMSGLGVFDLGALEYSKRGLVRSSRELPIIRIM